MLGLLRLGRLSFVALLWAVYVGSLNCNDWLVGSKLSTFYLYKSDSFVGRIFVWPPHRELFIKQSTFVHIFIVCCLQCAVYVLLCWPWSCWTKVPTPEILLSRNRLAATRFVLFISMIITPASSPLIPVLMFEKMRPHASVATRGWRRLWTNCDQVLRVTSWFFTLATPCLEPYGILFIPETTNKSSLNLSILPALMRSLLGEWNLNYLDHIFETIVVVKPTRCCGQKIVTFGYYQA